MADDTNSNQQPSDAGADPSLSAAGAASASQGDSSTTNALPPATQEVQAAPAKTFLQALEAEVKRAEAAGEHAAHAVLNDLHMLSVQIKSKAAAALGAFEGEAGDMVQFLHDML